MFKPHGFPMHHLESVEINLDELEAVKLCDYDNLDQTQAAEEMQISRGTIQRLLYAGRKKIIDAIINSKALMIENPHPHQFHHPRDFPE
jgi:predicted DNA-binding protein (UPF0251 family)